MTYQSWDADIRLVKIDANGQLLWKQTVKTDSHTMLSKILRHPAGGYVIAGSNFHGGNFDVILTRVDENGRMQD